MNIKSIMLGTAAGLMAVSGAQAADLPGEPVPVAVDYVRVCDTFGAGFFYIPGTETCLDISGRVRFRVSYLERGLDDRFDGDEITDDAGNVIGIVRTDNNDDVIFRADGRVDFDARTATEYGTLRSFFRVASGGSNQSDAVIDSAYIQLGYLTVGYAGDLFNGDVLYGIDGFAYSPGDQDRVQITVLADDLGGGFYAGASIADAKSGNLRTTIDNEGDMMLMGAVGIAGQPWGGIDLSVAYGPDLAVVPFSFDDGAIGFTGPNSGEDFWAVKATADLTLMENLSTRLVAAYSDSGLWSDITLAGALAYSAGAATVYGGIRYDMVDITGDTDADIWGANVGIDYTVVDGLVATAELDYADVDYIGDTFAVQFQLSRTW